MKHHLINKNFTSLWIWEFITLLNGKFRQVIIPLLILTITHSPLATSIVSLAQALTGLLFVVPISTWVERKHKLKTAAISRVFYGIGLFLLAFTLTFEGVHLVVLTCIMVVMQVVQIVSSTAFSVIIPKIAGRENLLKAHTSIEAAEAIATLIGPVIGGFLLGTVGAVVGLIVCGSLSLLATFFLYFIDYEEDTSIVKGGNAKEQTKAFFSDSLAGFYYLKANPQQIISTFTASVLNFSTIFIELSLIFYVRMALGFSEEQVGLLLSSMGIGTIIGLFLIRYFEKLNWIRSLAFLLLLSGAGVVVVTISNHFIMMCIGMALFDCGLSMGFVIQGTVHQGISPDEYLSRINGAYYLVGGIFGMLGTFLAGVLPEVVAGQVGLIVGIIVLSIPAVVLLQLTRFGVETSKLEPIYINE
jgi:MFS family permease